MELWPQQSLYHRKVLLGPETSLPRRPQERVDSLSSHSHRKACVAAAMNRKSESSALVFSLDEAQSPVSPVVIKRDPPPEGKAGGELEPLCQVGGQEWDVVMQCSRKNQGNQWRGRGKGGTRSRCHIVH